MDKFEFPYGRDIPLVDGGAIEVVLASTHVAVTNPTLETGVLAARVYTGTDVADNDTLTGARLDGTTQVYTWKTTLTASTIGQVLIGASNTTALTNMASALSGGGTTTEVTSGTEPCLDWDVASGATTLTITAINYGEDYDAPADAFAQTGASSGWAAATDGEDTPDFRQSLDFGTAATAVAAPKFRDGVAIFCPTAAQLTMKRGVFELDDNGGTDFVRKNVQVITTDHPLAGKPNGALYAGILDDPTDLASDGKTVEIPNSSHADHVDWVGNTTVSVPDVDSVINSLWMVLENPYSGARAVAEIKAYDFTDAGFGTNQGKITFVVGGAMRIPATLRAAAVLWYTIYESNVGLSPELGVQAKLDVNAEADTAISNYDPPTKAEMDTGHTALQTPVDAILIDTANMQPKFVGITLLNEWLGMIAGKQNADATALTEIKATGAGSGTYDPNADSGEAIADGISGGGPTAAAIADAVWDELQAAHVIANSFGVIATEIAALKVIIDKMVFTKTNELDVNVKSINEAEVVGDGDATGWDGV